MRNGEAASRLRSPSSGSPIRPLQGLSSLIDHLASDPVVFNFSVAISEAPALLLRLAPRHAHRARHFGQGREFLVHGLILKYPCRKIVLVEPLCNSFCDRPPLALLALKGVGAKVRRVKNSDTTVKCR